MGGGLRAATEIPRLDVNGRLPFGRERTIDHKTGLGIGADVDGTVGSQAEAYARDEDAKRREEEDKMFGGSSPERPRRS